MTLSLKAAPALLDLPSVIAILVSSVFVAVFFLAPASLSAQASDELSKTHYKLGVALEESNLRAQTSDAHLPRPDRPARIQGLYVYPVKSCRGIELGRSKVEPKGLEFDRLYTFARRRPGGPAEGGNEHDRRGAAGVSDEERPEWEIATLRQLPLLANVYVDVWLPYKTKLDRLGRHAQGSENGFIVVRFPWKDASWIQTCAQRVTSLLRRDVPRIPQREIILPLDFPSPEEIREKGYRYEKLQFFAKSVSALNMGSMGSKLIPELATYLGARGPLSLFRMDPNRQRQVMRNAPRKEVVGFQPVVDFQDAYPLHLLNLTSARALESKIPEAEALPFLDALRFRPNIIVSGLPAYDEDDWRLIRTKSSTGRDDMTLDVSCRTVRCKLPNVDPATGIRHRSEPDNTLRKHRDIDEGAPKKACFGMQLCPLFAGTEDSRPRRLQGLLEVGMEIDVVQRGPHYAL